MTCYTVDGGWTVEGSLEGPNRLNSCSYRRQFVPVLNGPWKEHLIHCDIGVRDEKPLWPSCSAVVRPDDGF